jgi:hypothetical protein
MSNQQADDLAKRLGETKPEFMERLAKTSRSALEQAYVRLHLKCLDKDLEITRLETKLRSEQYMVGVREAEIAELRGQTSMPERDDEEES